MLGLFVEVASGCSRNAYEEKADPGDVYSRLAWKASLVILRSTTLLIMSKSDVNPSELLKKTVLSPKSLLLSL